MIGNKIISYGIVESTNKTANELLALGGLEEGSVVVASFQEAVKGQPGNHWESEAGKNLTISVILYPAFLLPEKQFMLNKIISLGVVDFTRIMLPESARPPRQSFARSVSRSKNLQLGYYRAGHSITDSKKL